MSAGEEGFASSQRTVNPIWRVEDVLWVSAVFFPSSCSYYATTQPLSHITDAA